MRRSDLPSARVARGTIHKESGIVHELAGSLPAEGFRHVGLLYAGDDDFLASTAAFVRDGLAAREPTLAVLSADKIDRLRGALGADAAEVQFADRGAVGANPARIIPAWAEFLDAHAGSGRQVRGIGEPVTSSRSSAELVECQHHESLLNLAFDDQPAFLLLCPYDTEALAPALIDEARRSHPFLEEAGAPLRSPDYRQVTQPLSPAAHPLPAPAATPVELALEPGSLTGLRSFVARRAREEGLSQERTDDLVLCVNEVASNSLLYGGAYSTVRFWREQRTVICEVRDRGHFNQPLAGRRLPDVEDEGRRGLWMVNQLCDLVQVRSSPDGTTVRLHVADF